MKLSKPTKSTLNLDIKALISEFFGTFFLTFIAAGGIVINAISKNHIDYLARVLAPGLLTMAMIYSLGDISGAHINPAVTFSFALRGSFPWKKVPGYILVQILGAISAAFILYILFGNVMNLGSTTPHFGIIRGFFMELILSGLLITVIISTATGNKIVGPNAGIAVGLTIALCGMLADPISDASMNPARSLGPALVSKHFKNLWIYLTAPFIGALLAVGFNLLIHGKSNPEEKKAARGQNRE